MREKREREKETSARARKKNGLLRHNVIAAAEKAVRFFYVRFHCNFCYCISLPDDRNSFTNPKDRVKSFFLMFISVNPDVERGQFYELLFSGNDLHRSEQKSKTNTRDTGSL
jgi:hypothetical protein